MSRWQFFQLALYEFFDVVPFVILAAASFRECVRSKRLLLFFTAILYIMGFARRSITLRFPASSVIFSILWVALYLLIYYYVIRQPLSRLLFVLVTVLNYASIAAILYSYLGSRLFSGQLQEYPYCLEASLSILMVLAVTFPPMLYWLTNRVSPLINAQENSQVWARLWLVPATFCVFFYFNLYTSKNALTFSSYTHNLIYSLVISAGSFFVLSLVLRLVEASFMNEHLLAEKHQLELHTLQYEPLLERMEEARRARHDLRHCINVLQVYLKEGDEKQLRDYAEQISSSMSLDEPIVYCSYPPLNALICYYGKWAARNQVDFHAQVEYPVESPIQDTELVVLFGNLLENAAEACGRQSSQERFIRLKVQIIGGQAVIVLDNSCEQAVRKKGDSFYSSKRPGFGIGISSVRKIAGKYQGIVSFKEEGNVFSASVILNLPISAET